MEFDSCFNSFSDKPAVDRDTQLWHFEQDLSAWFY